MPDDLAARITSAITARGGDSVTPKVLSKRLGLTKSEAAGLRRALRNLLKQGKIEYSKNHSLRAAGAHGTITGTFRRTSSGDGYVRPRPTEGVVGKDIFMHESDAQDAASGDDVFVKITRRPGSSGAPAGVITSIVQRAT